MFPDLGPHPAATEIFITLQRPASFLSEIKFLILKQKKINISLKIILINIKSDIGFNDKKFKLLVQRVNVLWYLVST